MCRHFLQLCRCSYCKPQISVDVEECFHFALKCQRILQVRNGFKFYIQIVFDFLIFNLDITSHLCCFSILLISLVLQLVKPIASKLCYYNFSHFHSSLRATMRPPSIFAQWRMTYTILMKCSLIPFSMPWSHIK